MLTRREFIKLCLSATASLTLSQSLAVEIAKAFAGAKKPPVVWLEACTCTGDILSFANTINPDLGKFIFETIDLLYNNTLMKAQGAQAIEVLENALEKRRGEYILVVEGTVPTRDNGRYNIIGERNGHAWTALEATRRLSEGAQAVIAAGTCAAFGGIYAASPNPSDSRPVHKVVKQPVINVPGCPAHPDWLMGTITHLLFYGRPELDAHHRPKLFFGETIHNLCQRRSYFDNSIFAKYPGDGGCMYQIGCKGPVTHADCPKRLWSGEHVNWPVQANTPCIGCSSPEFTDGLGPFFVPLPATPLPRITTTANRVGGAVAVATALAIGGHLAGTVLTGRLGKGAQTDEDIAGVGAGEATGEDASGKESSDSSGQEARTMEEQFTNITSNVKKALKKRSSVLNSAEIESVPQVPKYPGQKRRRPKFIRPRPLHYWPKDDGTPDKERREARQPNGSSEPSDRGDDDGSR
ncbi:MAG: hydrogenase small subunit [Firmicutes bacterium]|nr:hydrogenase small subunit [Bacillota bacterium]